MSQKKNLLLIVASMGVFVEALDIAIINLAIPLIQKQFSLGSDKAYLLQSLYVLTYGGFLILGGKLSDIYGKKRTFIAGAALFLITSFCAGISVSFESLLFFRAVQGLAAALIMPSSFSIVNHYFNEGHERSKAIGIFSSFAAVGSGSGLSIGGIIASSFGWSWVFFINVPILALLIIAAILYLENDRPSRRGVPDLLSALFLIGVMFPLTFICQLLEDINENLVTIIFLIIVAACCFKLLIARLRKHKEPLIDLSLLRISSLKVGNVLFLVLGAFFTGYLFLISLVLQQNFGFSSGQAGIALVPYSIVSALVAKFVLPLLVRKLDNWSMAFCGICVMLFGAVFLMTGIHFHYLVAVLAGSFFIAGIGMTICFTSFSVIAIEQVPPNHLGVGSSLTTTAYFIGGGLGLPVLSGYIDNNHANVTVTSGTMVVLCGFAILGIAVLCLNRPKRKIDLI